MGVELNGIAHIQLTVTDASCIPFWEQLCHFLEMRTLIKSDVIVYCIGSRTGILVRADPEARSRGAAPDAVDDVVALDERPHLEEVAELLPEGDAARVGHRELDVRDTVEFDAHPLLLRSRGGMNQ